MNEEQYIHVYLDRKTAILLEKVLMETGQSRSGFIRKALMNEFKRMSLEL